MTNEVRILGNAVELRLGRGLKTDAEKLALDVREDLGIANHDRLPASRLAKRLGFRIKFPCDISGMPSEALHELTHLNKNRWSAILIFAEVPHPTLIINNPTHSVERQESNVFHEIAHALCGHKPDAVTMLGGLPLRKYSKEKEDQAEIVAFALHLSRADLFWAAFQGMTRNDIGVKYCASGELVRHRINSSGIEKILKRRIP